MAVKEFKVVKGTRKKTPAHRVHIAIAVAVIAVFAVTLFGVIMPNYSAADKYKEQIAQIEAQKAALDNESKEISDSLENKEMLFEKIAREDYGFCKPGEKVFYSSSFGE